MHERRSYIEFSPDLAKLTAKKRVCAYARVSSDKDEAFHSLSAQIGYYQQIIAENPDWEFVEVFSDRGITGTKQNREGFQRMLAACREGKIDIVLAKSITRFARNTLILLETVRELRSLGIDIQFEEERINTLSEKGELMISILAARAQEESRQASENQKWRIQKMFEKGLPVGGDCLGYRLVDHEFLIEDEEEQLVLRIFSMYLSGMGKNAIARKLTEEGVPTKCGKPKWNPNSIDRIIHNEKYCGDLVLQKYFRNNHIEKKKVINRGERKQVIVRDNHDAIINRADFERTQSEIEARAKKYQHDTTKTHHLFSGMIRCGQCQKLFTRNCLNSGTKYQKGSWACQTSITYGKAHCSMTQRIPESVLLSETCKLLQISELDEDVLKKHVKEIVVPQKNSLIYVLTDGTTKQVEWAHRSRRESWTPEMKEEARQRTLIWYQKRKMEVDKDGS